MRNVSARRWWQFSLRRFLIAALIVGPVIGLLGPSLWRAVWQWSPSSEAPDPPPASSPELNSYETESYYESGETPLY